MVLFPKANSASFVTAGSMAVPGEGTTLANYRAHGEWGEVQAEIALIATDARTFRLEGPVESDGQRLSGTGWSATLSEGWSVTAGDREGAMIVARTDSH